MGLSSWRGLWRLAVGQIEMAGIRQSVSGTGVTWYGPVGSYDVLITPISRERSFETVASQPELNRIIQTLHKTV